MPDLIGRLTRGIGAVSVIEAEPSIPSQPKPSLAALALRSRRRDLGQEFTDDTKRYIQMVERYLVALPGVEERKA